jgi:hypothetical protein
MSVAQRAKMLAALMWLIGSGGGVLVKEIWISFIAE